MSDSLPLHGPQNARLLCSPRVCSNLCPLNQWCYLSISSSAILPSFAFNLPQHQGLFQWAGSLQQVTKVLELQHPSFQWIFRVRIDWFYLFAVQRTLKSVLQHHNLKASVLQCSAFFMVLLSHVYRTTGKTIGLTVQAFVGKVMSLLFNTLSRFVKAFLSRSKHLLISWLQSLSTYDFRAKKIT